jgi:hypothetical protein
VSKELRLELIKPSFLFVIISALCSFSYRRDVRYSIYGNLRERIRKSATLDYVNLVFA